MPPTASELEAVLLPHKECGEGNSDVKRWIVDNPTPDEEEKPCALVWDTVEGAPENVGWVRFDMLDYIGFGHHLDAAHFRVLPVKGRDLRTNTTALIRLIAQSASISGSAVWGCYRSWN